MSWLTQSRPPARAATGEARHLDPAAQLEHRDPTAKVTFDQPVGRTAHRFPIGLAKLPGAAGQADARRI